MTAQVAGAVWDAKTRAWLRGWLAWECCWRFGVASAEHAAWLRQGPGAHTGLGPAASANQMRLKFTSRPADDGKVVAAAPVAAAVADGGGCRPPRYNNLRTGVQSALGSFPTSTRQVPGPFGSTTRCSALIDPPRTLTTRGRRSGAGSASLALPKAVLLCTSQRHPCAVPSWLAKKATGRPKGPGREP